METWLVTGGGGFLGSNAGRVLHGKVKTVGTFRDAPNVQHDFDQVLVLDLLDVNSIRNTLTTVSPDVVLHAAAISGHEECESNPLLAHEVNAKATGELAQICATLNIKFVYISTDAVFDGSRGNYNETDLTLPFSVYGQTKLAGEKLALQNPASLIVRTNFFGWTPTGEGSILEFFVNSLEQKKHILGFNDFVVTSIYVDSLVDYIAQLVEREESGIYNIASSDALSKFEFGQAVAGVFGLDESLIDPVSAADQDLGTSRSRNISLNTRKVVEILGVEMPKQLDGIRAAFHAPKKVISLDSSSL